VLRARKKDVQPARSLRLVDGPKSLKKISILVATVRHGYEDHVTLVALNVLQILNEERLRCLFMAFNEKLRNLVVTYSLGQKFVDELALLVIYRVCPLALVSMNAKFERISTDPAESRADSIPAAGGALRVRAQSKIARTRADFERFSERFIGSSNGSVVPK
jgi:hypothetical protein